MEVRKMKKKKVKCLIVERHTWETGGHEQQLQFVLGPAKKFFGSGASARSIKVRLFMVPTAARPSLKKAISISKEYKNGTRRTNGFREMGKVPSSFVFFEETSKADVYDVWWLEDKVPIAVRYSKWKRAKDSQYGRGRYSTVVDAPAPRS